MARVLVTEQIDPVGIELLKANGHTVIQMQTRERSELLQKAADADAILVRILELDEELMKSLPNLRVISKHGVGVDNIDLAAAKRCGIAVTVTPGANSTSVAEHTFALMIALAKKLPYVAAQYRKIGFAAKNVSPGVELSGKTLGIIGIGNIGSRLARMAHFGFDMRVLAYDPYVKEVPEGVELTDDVARIFRESDFVSLHCVLNEETQHIANAERLAMMKPTAMLLNCGRGPLVDEAALIEALQAGRLAGAGLDVTEQEPCPPDSPLFAMPNVILTPHYAPTTRASAEACSRMAAENIMAVLAGEEVKGRLV
ncbi:MAG: hydroxyacid dehydrogenase [Oscillospiraceae bacterium]|nr:hydroxyacid dehydrogenase [Oscillospiraceae bacterium]